jgi:hypothetical protein
MYRFRRQFDYRSQKRLPGLATLNIELLLIGIGSFGLGVCACLIVLWVRRADHFMLPIGILQTVAFSFLILGTVIVVNQVARRLRAKPPVAH